MGQCVRAVLLRMRVEVLVFRNRKHPTVVKVPHARRFPTKTESPSEASRLVPDVKIGAPGLTNSTSSRIDADPIMCVKFNAQPSKISEGGEETKRRSP